MVLAWPWSSWPAPPQLVGMQNGTAALAKFGFLFFLLLFNILLIYLHALGLRFGTQDLSLQCRHSACGMGLVVAVLRLSCSKPHGILVPRRGIERKSSALQVNSQPLDQGLLVVSYKAKHTFCCLVRHFPTLRNVCVCMCVLSRARLFATPWTVARQAPLSVGFSRQEYWNGLPFPSPGNLPDPGIKSVSPSSPALAGRFFTTNTTWEALWEYL